MSCLKSTTYWVSLFHILHVKYGIKRPNSLSFFFIILASGQSRRPLNTDRMNITSDRARHDLIETQSKRSSSDSQLSEDSLPGFWSSATWETDAASAPVDVGEWRQHRQTTAPHSIMDRTFFLSEYDKVVGTYKAYILNLLYLWP